MIPGVLAQKSKPRLSKNLVISSPQAVSVAISLRHRYVQNITTSSPQTISAVRSFARPRLLNVGIGQTISTLRNKTKVLTPQLNSLLTAAGRIGKSLAISQSSTVSQILPVTWSPTDKSANIALTNNNLTAAGVNVGAWKSVRSTKLHSGSGKYYFEFTANAVGGSSGCLIGVCNSLSSLGSFVGGDVNGIGWQANQTQAWYNGSGVNSVDTLSSGMTIGVAVDIALSKVWFYQPTQNRWNGAASGSQNPATNTGGMTNFSMTGGLIYAGFSAFETGSASRGTANFGSSAFTYTIPSGFVAWGSA